MASLDIKDKLDGFDECDEEEQCLDNQPGDSVKWFYYLIRENRSEKDPGKGCAECHRPVILV